MRTHFIQIEKRLVDILQILYESTGLKAAELLS